MVKEKNKGITLIALIITIIVMLILVAVTINMAINGGLFEKAGEAVGKTQNEIDKEQEMANGGVTIDGTYYNSIDEYINREEEYVGLTITSETAGVTYTDKDGNTKELTEEVEDGDIIIYGDYEYRYNMCCDPYNSPHDTYWLSNSTQNGWGVKLTDRTKSSYGEVCGEILGQSVTAIPCLFAGTQIETSPAIPNTITNMRFAFYACRSLTKVPKLPSVVEDLGSTFWDCQNLTEAPTIPESVTNMAYTFSGCENLTGTITINANPESYTDCFKYTSKPITLKGNTLQTKLEALAATSSGNVSVATTE